MGKVIQTNIVGKQGTPAKITNRRALLVDMQNESGQSISENIEPKLRRPNIIRTTAAGTIAPIVYDCSVSNVGLSDGVFLGAIIRPGETFSYSAGALNNTYAAGSITYDGTGTELIIAYNS